MSAKPRSTLSPKRKRTSPRPNVSSKNSQRKQPKQLFKTKVTFTVLAILALCGVTGWLVSADLRESRASRFDTDSLVALKRHDFTNAYRDARLATALKPTPVRHLALGSLAYLRQDYSQALSHFRDVGEAVASPSREQGLLGVAAAAGRRGDTKAYREARDLLGRPADDDIRLGLAFAAIDAGDLPTTSQLTGTGAPQSEVDAYARLIGALAFDPSSVSNEQTIFQASPQLIGQLGSYQRFLRELMSVPDDAFPKLDETRQRMLAVVSPATRQLLLAQTLLDLGEARAAEEQALTAVRAESKYRDGYNTLAASQMKLGQFKDAGRSLKTSIDLDRAFGYTWYLRAELAAADGDSAKADEYRAKARSLGFSCASQAVNGQSCHPK